MSDSLQIFLNSHKILDLLGSGSYAKVYKVKRLCDDAEFALKIVELQKAGSDAYRECKISFNLPHKHILLYMEQWQCSWGPIPAPPSFPQTTPLLYIIMECCDSSLRERLNEKEQIDKEKFLRDMQKFAVHVSKGLSFIHEQEDKILHRDLNPSNILLKMEEDGEEIAKIADFGLSRQLSESGTITSTKVGCQLYQCPEQKAGLPYTEKCDVFSMGIMLYEMFHPKLLLAKQSEPDGACSYYCTDEMTNLIQSETRATALEDIEGGDLRGIIEAILRVEPDERPSSSIVNQLLSNLFPQFV